MKILYCTINRSEQGILVHLYQGHPYNEGIKACADMSCSVSKFKGYIEEINPARRRGKKEINWNEMKTYFRLSLGITIQFILYISR